jgi:MerR family transcriptional regulator, copper efflux regulator
MASGLTIGQLAKTAGVNVQTVRYYERRNLLQPTGRKASGYRVYGDDVLKRLRFIKNAQALGFTLHEINDLLNLRVSAVAQCGTVRVRAQAKLRQVEAKTRDLLALSRALKRLICSCRTGEPTEHCPILQTLDKETTLGR